MNRQTSDILKKTIAEMEKGGRRTLEETLPVWLIDCEFTYCQRCVAKIEKQLANHHALVVVSGDKE